MDSDGLVLQVALESAIDAPMAVLVVAVAAGSDGGAGQGWYSALNHDSVSFRTL